MIPRRGDVHCESSVANEMMRMRGWVLLAVVTVRQPTKLGEPDRNRRSHRSRSLRLQELHELRVEDLRCLELRYMSHILDQLELCSGNRCRDMLRLLRIRRRVLRSADHQRLRLDV